MKNHEYFLKEAINESARSVKMGGYPVGSIIVKDGKIIARGISNGKNLTDPTSHAEIDAIRKAGKKLKSKFLKDCTLYTSCETCMMCYFASNWARIPEIFYACSKAVAPMHYYETSLSVKNIKSKTYYKKNPQKIIHFKNLELKAKSIIDKYEKSLKPIIKT